ncbi:Transposon Tf2-11 polyprotein [Eumeta japonica]|uniref:RNA-directed DNA polymerase n=1 Tax=Eumeta variegata TaxID=151549 RepID=A0A4C1WP33_EUMVA|nr:Transposon Tf2-11 polyprotein [Eumeta japonica]
MHLGWEKTLEKAFDFYWFSNMRKYVRKFVENCITCKVSKSKSGKTQAELHPITKVTVPWHTIHIDATGKLSGQQKSKEYIFVLINAFTKYVLLRHTSNIDAVSAVNALKAGLSLFGAPTRVIADQGRCFANKHFRDFCNTNNIHLHLISTGTSRANGQVERVMSTLKNMLTAVEVNKERTWQDAVDDVQLAFNCTVNRVVKASPLELLIGKVARPLSLLALGDQDQDDVDIVGIKEQAVNSINANARMDKERFDRGKAKVSKFTVGDFVLIENHERNQTKLDPKFRGPFKIVELLDGDRYLLKAIDSNRTYQYAHERLRAMPNCYVPPEFEISSYVDGVEEQATQPNKF